MSGREARVREGALFDGHSSMDQGGSRTEQCCWGPAMEQSDCESLSLELQDSQCPFSQTQ